MDSDLRGGVRLKPEAMTPETMARLEEMGLIRRMLPGRDCHQPDKDATRVETIYTGRSGFGPHRLIAVTVGTPELKYFGLHSDNEDVLLLGRGDCRPMYLVMAQCGWDAFGKKYSTGRLSADDFVCLAARYNDPETSFFTILKGVPHGECVSTRHPGAYPSFYVTEPADLDLELFDLRKCEVVIDD